MNIRPLNERVDPEDPTAGGKYLRQRNKRNGNASAWTAKEKGENLSAPLQPKGDFVHKGAQEPI